MSSVNALRASSSAAASCSGRVLHQRPNVRTRVMSGFPSMPPGGGRGGPAAPPPEPVARDPDNLYKGIPLKTGIIERRMMTKRMEEDKEFAKAMTNASDELRQAQLLRRETRRPPANHLELIEYFLNTMAEDLEFEVARYRPRLTPDFFQYVDSVLGAERFAAKPDEDRLAELDLLRKYLAEASEAVDKCVAATSSATDRVKKLLTAKDKKQMILDMAAANEIDQAMMDLLQQNIDAARNAGQEEPAKFMEKVKQACSKYLITAAVQPVLPQVPAQLGGQVLGGAVATMSAPSSSGAPLGRSIITATTAAADGQASKAAAAAPAAAPAVAPARQHQAAPGGGVILTPNQAPPKQPGSLIL